MQSFFDLRLPKIKPWLIIGKGPSYEKLATYDLSRFYLFGLNHISLYHSLDICHVIDLDVLEYVNFEKHAYIVMPWHPHKNFKVHEKNLSQLGLHKKIPNLVWYNLSTWKHSHNIYSSKIIRTKYFSAEAAFRLLIAAGITSICSIGIDGGKEYAKTFKEFIPLTNGQKSFDCQFKEINKIICETSNLNYHAL